jgi:hypothetical protein
MTSFLDKMLPTIGALAPTIATALGGPLAGMAVTGLASALGVEPAAAQTPAGQADMLKKLGLMDPATVAAMQKAENDFKLALSQQNIDLAKINEADTESARALQVQTKSLTPAALAGFVTAGFFGLLSLMAFHSVPAENQTVLNTMLGALGTSWLGIIHFYFGSSAGSQAKDATIQKMAS